MGIWVKIKLIIIVNDKFIYHLKFKLITIEEVSFELIKVLKKIRKLSIWVLKGSLADNVQIKAFRKFF